MKQSECVGRRNPVLASALMAVFPALLSTVAIGQAAPQAEAPSAQVEEVVITAQKRTEKLEDTPVAASVVSAEAVAKSNASDIADLNNLVPSVNLNGSFNGRVPMGMRGISSVSNEGTVGLSSGVAIMIDGVPVPSDSRNGNAMEDVQSVEVLKGPQATLGGRTAAAGVINMVTRKPSDSFTGSVDATLTNDGEKRLSGFISGPLSDMLDYSISAYGNQRYYPIKNLRLDQKTNQDTSGVKGKLLFKPTKDLDITFTASTAEDDSSGSNFVYTYMTPGNGLLIGPGGPPFLSQAVLLPGITANFNNQVYSSPVTAKSNVRDKNVSLNVDYRLGDLTFGSTTAWQDETQANYQDVFIVDNFFWNLLTGAGSPGNPTPPFFNIQTQAEDIKQFSQEFKLASPTDQTLSYLVGAFYSDTTVNLHYQRLLPPALYDAIIRSETKTADIYGRTTLKLGPTTSLLTGLRFNDDTISYNTFQPAYAASFPNQIYNNLSSSGSSSSTATVGDISLQQRLGEDTMVYATYARGYSPAAYNTSASLTPTSLSFKAVPKEDIDHIELGSKGTYFDRRVSVNTALFDTVYKNFQVQIFDQANTSINPPLILTPAGKAETRGLELDVAFAATDKLRLNFNAAYIDAKFKDYKGAPCWFGQQLVDAACTGTTTFTQDLTGKVMPNSPKLKYIIGVEQKIPLEGIPYNVVLGGNYTHRSSVQMLVDQNPQAIQPALGLLNLSATLNSNSDAFSATLFVNNVFDKHYFVDLEDFFSGPWGGLNTVIGQPARDTNRYAGIKFRWNLDSGVAMANHHRSVNERL